MTSGRPASIFVKASRIFDAARGKRAEPSERAWSGEASFLLHVRSSFPDYRFVTVFDVGAHVGAVSARFLDCFPGASLHAFEPAPETFAALSQALGKRPGVTLNELALSDSSGEAAFSAQGQRTFNRLLARQPKPSERGVPSVVTVRTQTGDAYCAAAGLTAISFLKIDSEGHDLKVLEGFSELLRSQAVDFIQVEAGMHPENSRHVPFERLKAHLEARGYRLLQIDGQSRDPELKILRRADLIFVSLKLAEARRTARPKRAPRNGA